MSKGTTHYIYCDLCQDQTETADARTPPGWVVFVPREMVEMSVCPVCVAAITNPEEPAPDAVNRGGEETEEQMAERFRRVCQWCGHSQAWHPVAGGVMPTCGALNCHCPVMRGDPVFGEAGGEDPVPPRDESREQLTSCYAALPRTPPAPDYVTCKDCGDPWIWHGQAPGAVCTALLCRCANQRSQADRFVVPETGTR